jgi:predicted acyltransferase
MNMCRTNPDSTPPLEAIAAPRDRIASLDQFRGYTVAGMLFVNFLNGFDGVPAVLKHHNTYCSYADTIMPQFFFAVGFAYRLTFLKRLRALGPRAATAAAVRRNLGLIVLGFVLYHLDGGATTWAELAALGPAGFAATAFQRTAFQTLVHIALASLWVLPVIAARPPARVGYLVLSAALHLGLSRWFYFDWAWARPVIDGGPLGFLSWSVPLLVGSLAFDAVGRGGDERLWKLTGWSFVLMGVGYGLSCVGRAPAAPPFLAPAAPVTLWTMSQRTGSISYLTFASGFSLLVYAAFVAACDRGGLRVGLFRTFGRNALAAYVLHGLVASAVKPYVPRDAPGWYVAAGFLLYFGISYGLVRGLEKQGVFIKL